MHRKLFSYIILFAGLSLTACGFQPIYGSVTESSQQSAVEDRMAQIVIGNIPDREGQILRNALIDRLYAHGRPANPVYTLNLSPLKQQTVDLDITEDSDTTRRQLTVSTRLSLKNNQNNEIVLQRNLRSTIGYNVIGSQFTTRISEEDALESVLNDLARQTELQLSLYLNR